MSTRAMIGDVRHREPFTRSRCPKGVGTGLFIRVMGIMSNETH